MPVNQHSDPGSSPFEDQLSAALHDTGGAFDADRLALADAGQARGRRLRLRRRAAVVGGVASLALVGVGGALLLPGDGTPEPGTSRVAAPPKSTATPAARQDPVYGTQLIRMLEEALPKGTLSDTQARGTHDEAGLPPRVEGVYDDGKGAAALSVNLDRIQPGGQEAGELGKCPDEVFVPMDGCTVSRLSDGSLVRVVKGYEYPDRRVDTKMWSADLVSATGQHVSVVEWNAAAEKDSPISRPEPPLSPAQLKEFVAAKEWREVVDAIPEDPHQPAEPTPPADAPSGKAVPQTLLGLLPKGLKVVRHSGEDGQYAYVIVDDGKGQSFVQINVQPDMRDVADQLYGKGSETLADGTKVMERQGPGEKGGSGVVMWTVDTMRTDGYRVVISAFNARTQNTDATRPIPALSMKQLREIALSPKWLQLR
ncbi:hypothetical protein ACGFNV_08990 [Streptomyces sp. NPDC048751]|uniref:hypothetical protein n=1 Tax=Streptomyces sp. NPDC048751 TaxID=3365591 RepID=UPI00371359A3